MSRDDHKIETSLEGIEHLSKENINKNERKKKGKNHCHGLLAKVFFIWDLMFPLSCLMGPTMNEIETFLSDL